MIALVLAAGLGTRFRPDTLTTPKPLLTFNGRPILHHLLDHLLAHGVHRFVLNSHHLAELLESAVGTSYRGVPVDFSREEERILGTAGGIRQAADRGLLGDGPFLVANGDLYTTLPLHALWRQLDGASSAVASVLAVLPNESPQEETPLWSDSADRLIGVGGRRPKGARGPWLFTGLQAARPSLVARIPPGVTELAKDVLVPSALDRDGAFLLKPFQAPEEGFWFDLGSPAKMARAEEELRQRAPHTGSQRREPGRHS